MKIKEALQNLVYLHAREQEGVESGQPTTEQPTNELSDEEYRTMLFERSQLFMPYGVKDKEGKFRDVVDVQTVIEIFKEQHTSPKPNK